MDTKIYQKPYKEKKTKDSGTHIYKIKLYIQIILIYLFPRIVYSINEFTAYFYTSIGAFKIDDVCQ